MIQSDMHRRNYPLLFGGILTAIFIVLALFGPRLAPHDPMQLNRVMQVGGEWLTAPFPPFTLPAFPLGTDQIGRDLLSRIFWAVRPTLLVAVAVVAVRTAAGIVLGLMAGWYRGLFERIVDAFISASLAVPTLVFAIGAILYIGLHEGLRAFVIGLSIIGWAEIAAFVKNRTLSIMQAPYIEGAQALGAPPRRILRRYVLPQLWPVLPALISFELAAVILLLAELGFLGIFIGGGIAYEVPASNSPGNLIMVTSGIPELGQLISDFWAKIIQTPWVPFFVGVVIFLQIFAFNLLGEGLRRHMDVTRPRRSWLRRLAWRRQQQLQAVDEVEIRVA